MDFWKKIVKERYADKGTNENWEGICERVSSAISKNEKPEDREAYKSSLKQLIQDRMFIPGGRILRNAGTPYPMLINCSVIGSKDTREAIGQTLKEVLILGSTGCGIGIPGDAWRPKNAKVKSLGHKSCGPVGWFKAIDAVALAIAHGSDRELALMFSLSVYHPDIEDFISAKETDLTALTHANMSVSIDNAFIKAVKEDTDIELTFGGVVYRTISAKKLWNKIISNAWKTGEPGILNSELANEMSNSWYCSPLITTNPCLFEDTMIKTKTGLKMIKDVLIGDVIWSSEGWTDVINHIDQGEKEVAYTRNPLGMIVPTLKHKVVSNGEKVELQHAKSIDSLLGPVANTKEEVVMQDIINGAMSSNGKMYHEDQHSLIGIPVIVTRSKDAEFFAQFFKHHFVSKFLKDKTSGNPQLIFAKTDLNKIEIGGQRVPVKYMQGSDVEVRGFLKGVFSSWGDYSPLQQKFVFRRQDNIDYILDLQVLLSSIGIMSYVEQDKIQNDMYDKKEYVMYISGKSFERFLNIIRFIDENKTQAVMSIYPVQDTEEKYSLEVNKYKISEPQRVYDITVNNSTNTLWANGFNVSNCGEQWLPADGICDLGSIVLDRFYNKDLKENQRFPIDYLKLGHAVNIAVRTLDNVLDIGKFPLDSMEYVSSQERRIGLGAMGYHSFLLLAGIKFSSDEGVGFIEHISETMSYMAYRASIQLAIEKGPFPLFDRDKYLQGKYIQALPEDIKTGIRKYGIRNICITTIPPHGTTGLVAESTTSCEPLYSAWYKRKRKLNKEYVDEYLEDPSYTKIKKINPDVEDVLECSKEIPVDVQLEIQKRLSRVIDSGISKTINIPKETTPEELSEKILAYAPYIKGITVYRRGSRGNEPIQEITEEEYLKHKKEAKSISLEDKVDFLKEQYRCANGTCDV